MNYQVNTMISLYNNNVNILLYKSECLARNSRIQLDIFMKLFLEKNIAFLLEKVVQTVKKEIIIQQFLKELWLKQGKKEIKNLQN